VEHTTTSRQPIVRRYAKKVARKALSREKKLERYVASGDRVEKPKQGWQMKLDFGDRSREGDGVQHLSQDAFRLQDLAVGYQGDPTLLEGLNLRVAVRQRIAFSGPNGSGKTTLLRTIAGKLPPLDGKVHLGANVKLGYMSQEQELLDPELNALESLRRIAPLSETEARSFLHYFLFSGDDALRPACQLSYGERARLRLATLVAEGCTLLLLDEPINHLDIPSREKFEAALAGYEGTVLAVVHDRYFIQRFATELWIVEGKLIRREVLVA
jgi:ATP-binding cassette subfamily F protein 3